MSLDSWIISYAVEALVCLWIVYWGGDRFLEGSFLSGCLVSVFAPRWSAEGLRFFAGAALLLSTGWFIAGIFVPELRIGSLF